ncbi:MAG: NAD(P)H-dependent oxidoreductase [Chitinophagaceae bacterium]|nr:NAD(P)H-dependent oxidoreductase [Anaerolineae bacterium]
MNILIVYAHPDPQSFCGVMKDQTLKVLVDRGHSVQVSDLYAMKFKAAADHEDYTHDALENGAFELPSAQLYASQHGTFAPDVVAEQQKVLWADYLIFQFPLWWYSLPAITKGWMDRVFALGFAYGQGRSLAGRRAMCVLTTGGPARVYTPEMRQALIDLLNPVMRGTLHFCGLRVLPPYAVYGAANMTLEQRNEALRQYSELLIMLERVAPVDYTNREK